MIHYIVAYIIMGLFTLMCSSRAIRNSVGFVAIAESLAVFALWPAAWMIRLVIFFVEGNMWEHLS